MLEIVVNKDGVACIVTDNPTIADAIHGADEDNMVPVWFTGSPNLSTARELVKGLEADFGRKAAVGRGGPNVFHAFFTEPVVETPWDRIAKLNRWLSEHESMLAKARMELNQMNRKLASQKCLGGLDAEWFRRASHDADAYLKAAGKEGLGAKITGG